MKEYDKRKGHINGKILMIYIYTYLLITLDILLLRPSLHFTTLHPTTLNSTSLTLNTSIVSPNIPQCPHTKL